MEDYGLVSIITPNYNCGKFIAETIESVQAQTYQNWEMLIQDDCSTDNSLNVAKEYASKDSRIKIESNLQNSGAAITRNNALRRAKGRWIAFLDSDDLWLPEKLDCQLEFMSKNDYAFTYHDYEEISENNEPLGIYVSGKKNIGRLGMFSCCWPGCLSVIYDFNKIGLIQINDVKKNNDSAIWLKVIRKTNCHLLGKKLARYRRRKGSITPPGIMERIMWQYRLFRDAEEMNPLAATFWMGVNTVFSFYKKTFYLKRYKIS